MNFLKRKCDALVDYFDDLKYRILYFFDEDIYDYVSENVLFLVFILLPNILLLMCTFNVMYKTGYIFLMLFLFSVYNSIVFFERKRTYQIFNSNISELDNLYSINRKDETNFTRGNFFNERPRPGIPNFKKSVHPSNSAKYKKDHEKPFFLYRLFNLVLGLLGVVLHFLTVGILRNKRVKKNRLFKEKEKVNRMTHTQKKRQEEINSRPANMTTYYDDMGPKIEPATLTNTQNIEDKENIYEIEMWEYSQYDRVLVTYFSPIQVMFMYAIYYGLSDRVYSPSILFTKAILILCVYIQSIFLDRVMINLEKKESDKKIIYAQAQKEQIEFNNRFNQVKNQYLTNIIRENNINISLPTDYHPFLLHGNSNNGSPNNGNNTDENPEQEEIIIEERSLIQNKQTNQNPRRESIKGRIPSSIPSSSNQTNYKSTPPKTTNSKTNMQLILTPSESSISESRYEHSKIREEIRQKNIIELDIDESRRNNNRKQPIVSSSQSSSIDEENQKKRKENEENIFQKHTRKKVKH